MEVPKEPESVSSLVKMHIENRCMMDLLKMNLESYDILDMICNDPQIVQSGAVANYQAHLSTFRAQFNEQRKALPAYMNDFLELDTGKYSVVESENEEEGEEEEEPISPSELENHFICDFSELTLDKTLSRDVKNSFDSRELLKALEDVMKESNCPLALPKPANCTTGTTSYPASTTTVSETKASKARKKKNKKGKKSTSTQQGTAPILPNEEMFANFVKQKLSIDFMEEINAVTMEAIDIAFAERTSVLVEQERKEANDDADAVLPELRQKPLSDALASLVIKATKADLNLVAAQNARKAQLHGQTAPYPIAKQTAKSPISLTNSPPSVASTNGILPATQHLTSIDDILEEVTEKVGAKLVDLANLNVGDSNVHRCLSCHKPTVKSLKENLLLNESPKATLANDQIILADSPESEANQAALFTSNSGKTAVASLRALAEIVETSSKPKRVPKQVRKQNNRPPLKYPTRSSNNASPVTGNLVNGQSFLSTASIGQRMDKSQQEVVKTLVSMLVAEGNLPRNNVSSTEPVSLSSLLTTNEQQPIASSTSTRQKLVARRKTTAAGATNQSNTSPNSNNGTSPSTNTVPSITTATTTITRVEPEVVSGEPVPCSVVDCSLSFANETESSTHFKTHKKLYKCAYCGSLWICKKGLIKTCFEEHKRNGEIVPKTN